LCVLPSGCAKSQIAGQRITGLQQKIHKLFKKLLQSANYCDIIISLQAVFLGRLGLFYLFRSPYFQNVAQTVSKQQLWRSPVYRRVFTVFLPGAEGASQFLVKLSGKRTK